MKLYTKTGDLGETAIFGGKRLSKSAAQVSAYGDVDELSAWLGVIMIESLEPEDAHICSDIQNMLYGCMSMLSGATLDAAPLVKHTADIEKHIDSLDAKLPELRHFLLQQGTKTSVMWHVVRTVCRRAERSVVGFAEGQSEPDRDSYRPMLQYLNRLSDLFFVLARTYNTPEKEAKATFV
jgi:cob(I)alamin adenosyltransferase